MKRRGMVWSLVLLFGAALLLGINSTLHANGGDTIRYDFRDAAFSGREGTSPWNTRPSQPGWSLEGVPTNRPVLGLQNYGVSIGSTAVGDHRTFHFDVPEDGYYSIEFGALTYSAGGIGELFVDGDSIGTYNFYSPQSQSVTRPMRIKHLQAGTHTLVLQVVGKDPIAPAPPAPGYRMTASHFTLKGPDAPPELATITLSVDQPELHVGTPAKLGIEAKTAEGLGVDLSQAAIQYSSSDESIASVNGEGEFVPERTGEVIMQAKITLGGIEYTRTMTIYVVEAKLARIEADLLRTELFIGDRLLLKASGTLANGRSADLSVASVTYGSSHPEVAAVNPQGVVSALSVGEADISVTATLDGVTQTTVLSVSTQDVTNVKTRSTVYTPEKVAAARANVNLYDWAQNERNRSVSRADGYLQLGYEYLWSAITPQSVPRSFTTNRTAGSPITGEELNSFGAYPWIADPFARPWKLQDPTSGYVFPTNDYWAYYTSGLNENGIFEPELADRSLLVNELYPEKGPGWGVDDGTGWVDENGNRFLFVAYYNHWHNWGREYGGVRRVIVNVLTDFRDAFLYTGDARYARAGIIMLDRIADVYPAMQLDDYKEEDGYFNASGGTGRGKIMGSIWESILVDHFLTAYDAFYPAMDDAEAIAFLSGKSDQYHLGVLKKSAAGIRRNIEDGIVRQVYPAVKNVQIRGNTGMHQANLALAAVVLDHIPETKEILDFNFQAGSFYSSSKMITGGDVLGSLVNNFDRDGGGYHSAAGYNGLIYDAYIAIADILAGYDLYPSADLYQNVKLKKMFDSFWPLLLSDRYVPHIGDSGSTGNKTSLLRLERKIKAFEMFGDPIYAQLAYFLNGNRIDGIHGGIFDQDPDRIAEDIEQVIAEHGTLNLQGTNLTGYGFAALRDGEADSAGSTQRDLWMFYGMQQAHSHADTLNIGMHGFGLDLLPEIGYPETGSSGPQETEWVKNTVSHNTVVVDQSRQLFAAAQPRHFDHNETVKLIDVEASAVYPQTDMYRRTTALIRVDDVNSYAVDFFRIKGGQDHHFSFHAAEGAVTTEGLTLTEQAAGTYAGEDVEYRVEPVGYTGSGFHFLKNVARDEQPADLFSVDWQVKDTWNMYGNGAHADTNVHLRLTMLGETDEVALTDGIPSQNRPGNPESLRYLLAHRSGNNLNSLFTSVIEPYRGQRFIASIQPAAVKVGGEVVTEDVRAVKVTLASGRVDYIISALNRDILYKIDDKFQFQGSFGVYSEKNGEQIVGYVNDGSRIGDVTLPQAAVSGTVLDFTKGLSMDNEMTVVLGHVYGSLNDLVGRYIYIENDGLDNAVYKIKEVRTNGAQQVVLSTGDVTYVREWKDKFDFDKGFNYDFAEGASFTIPLSIEYVASGADEPDSDPISAMRGLIDSYEAADEIVPALGAQLRYRLDILALLFDQREEGTAAAYMQDFVSYIRDPSVLTQQLISSAAAEALHEAANRWLSS